MIDSVEPLSCVLWAVAFFAAGMYPLGFMMGAPCSPCCDAQCGDEPIEFNRCIRFVNTDTSAPPTTYAAGQTVSQPLHGFSRAVTRPEQIGARRVGTKADFTARLVLLQSARAMSDGETQSATYRYHYLSPTGADLGTAKQWNVTLVGVTRPLSMPSVVSTLQYQVGTGSSNANPAEEYSVGLLADSTSAAVSATVHSVAVVSGGQLLDGNIVTDEVLKAMLTATIPLRDGTTWVTRLAFAATNAQFQHVPTGTSITLEYVIKHSRGTQHRYRTFAMTVLKFGSPVAIPAGGLSPLSLSQPAAIDTPYAATPATYSNDDPDAVSIYSSDAAGEKILKTVEVVPVAEQMRRTISLTANNSAHLLPSNVSFVYAFTEYGYIMRPFDPGGGYNFDSNNHPANSPWNYNVEEVESFLSGGYTLPYNSGTTLVTHNNTWTMEVTEPTQFCGVPLCRGLHIIERSVLCKAGKLPSTWQTSSGQGTTNHTNQCFEQDDVPEFSMSLQNGNSQCLYLGSTMTCHSLASAMNREPFSFIYAGGPGPGQVAVGRNLESRVFYCGDLLWVIETGPCRETLVKPLAAGYGNDVFTLGGNAIAATLCPQSIATDYTCYVPEVGLNISGISAVAATPGFEIKAPCKPCGNLISKGTGWPLGDPTNAQGSFILPLGFNSCNAISYSSTFTINGVGIVLQVTASRDNWCEGMYLRNVGVTLTGPPVGSYGQPPLGLSFEGDNLGGLDVQTHFTCLNAPCFHDYEFGSLMGWWNEGNARNYYTGTYSLNGFAESGVQPTNIDIDPYDSSAPAGGGNVSVTVCCPRRVEVIAVPPTTERYDFTYRVPFAGTGYITQAGQGDTYCPFTIEWLSGSEGYPPDSRIFLKERCPIKGQVNHAEQPPCEWSVTSGAAWLIAEKMPEELELEAGEEDAEPAGDQVGLLKLIINTEEPAVFAGSFANTGKPFRSATITITSGTTVNTWTIIQLQP